MGQDNSFATDHPKNELRFGKGGVDGAEDAEVILHEYGHAIHFSQNFSFASEEAGAIILQGSFDFPRHQHAGPCPGPEKNLLCAQRYEQCFSTKERILFRQIKSEKGGLRIYIYPAAALAGEARPASEG